MNFNFQNIKDKIIKNWQVVTAVFLWFCVWGTYNAEISRFLIPGFPHNIFDLFHGLRSLLPSITLIFSAWALFKNRDLFKNIFWTPVGLLIVFSLLGIISGVFSRQPLMAMYWGGLFAGVLFLLLIFMGNKEILKKIIIVNFIIAGIIALGLTLFFFMQQGAVSSLTYNFLICSQRPYEGLGNVIQAGANFFDMAGTRPTGLGRYAGITAIFCLASFYFAKSKTCTRKKWFWLFVIFLGILLFSKGKAGMVAYIFSMIFLIWAAKKINILSILSTFLVIVISSIVIFYNVPCTNTPIFINKIVSIIEEVKVKNTPIVQETPVIKDVLVEEKIEPKRVVQEVKPVSELPKIEARKNVASLSGRTDGVWKDSWHLFLKNPLFGFGAQADRYFLNGQHAHNTIIHAILQTGILGTIAIILAFALLLVYLVKLFINPLIQTKDKQFLITITAVLIFFVVRGLTESLVFFSADWLFVAPIIVYIQCLYNELNINKKNEGNILEFRGSKVNIIKMPEVIEKMSSWIKNEKDKLHWIIVTGMHGIAEANKNMEFKKILSFADLWVSDGISLIWLARLKGLEAKERISGADLMKEFFAVSQKENFNNYFYGDTPETLNLLSKKTKENFPRLKVAGYFSPPFKVLNEKEEQEIIDKINNAKPDVLWVALGLPKQERWIYKNREKLKVPVVVGVGAAFKFLSGSVKRAPNWVGSMGLEWLWRLVFEFKTTWKRVFAAGPYFLYIVIVELIKFNKFKGKNI